jgi:hypothetical protein
MAPIASHQHLRHLQPGVDRQAEQAFPGGLGETAAESTVGDPVAY